MKFEIDFIIWLQSFSTSVIDIIAKVTSYLFDYPCILLVGILLFFFYKKDYGFYFLLVSGTSAIIQYVLKHIIARPRPYLVCNEIRNIYGAIGSAFPSGHSVSSMAIALFIGFALIKSKSKKSFKLFGIVGLIVYLILNLLNRTYLGQHYLTDIIAGYILMFIIAIISYFLYPIYKNFLNIFKKKTNEANNVKE